MRLFLLLLLGIVFAYIAYASTRFYFSLQVSKKLVQAAVPFEKPGEGGEGVLILGDSTAVGVGAESPEETVAGRVSTFLNPTAVENYAVSGARTEDLLGQLANATRTRYQLILIQIGGNDIIRFRSTESATENLRAALASLPEADKVVLISAGDVGGATLFPFFVRPFHTMLNNRYHDAFAALAKEEGIVYVNFGDAPATDAINKRPDLYLAADGLHPSSEGYRLWFETIQPSL